MILDYDLINRHPGRKSNRKMAVKIVQNCTDTLRYVPYVRYIGPFPSTTYVSSTSGLGSTPTRFRQVILSDRGLNRIRNAPVLSCLLAAKLSKGCVRQECGDVRRVGKKERMAEVFSIFQLSAAPQLQPPDNSIYGRPTNTL